MSISASIELRNLIADVEALLGKVADVADIDITRLRHQLQEKLGSARDMLAAGSNHISKTARQAAGATDDYVRHSPWPAVGIAALAGVSVAAVLLLAIGRLPLVRQQRRREADDLKRWEAEGGPPPPDANAADQAGA